VRLVEGLFPGYYNRPSRKGWVKVRRYNVMKKYENASIQEQNVSPIKTFVSDNSTSTSEVMANGMVLSYFDELISGNAE